MVYSIGARTSYVAAFDTASGRAPPQRVTHRHVRCDCGRVAYYRADVTLITGAGSIIHGRLFLCESCYAEFVAAERPARPAMMPTRPVPRSATR